MKAVSKNYADIVAGDTAQFTVTITRAMVDEFAKFSGDNNPLHTDEEYAKTTQFGALVPHGMIGGALFSRLVGMYLPGARSLYLSQSLFFRKPMRIGMEVVVSGEVLHKTDALQAITLKTQIVDIQTQGVLTDGEAMIKIV